MKRRFSIKPLYYFSKLKVKYPGPVCGKLGSILIKNEIDINKGMELISRALDLSPENLQWKTIKGLGHYKLGEIDSAFEILNETWDERPLYNHEHYIILKEVEQALALQE